MTACKSGWCSRRSLIMPMKWRAGHWRVFLRWVGSTVMNGLSAIPWVAMKSAANNFSWSVNHISGFSPSQLMPSGASTLAFALAA